ncbi:MAG: hypothetical protein JRJ03_07780 [Deltaproteobacteria bacterium]|nr:hypothetical protein [Deltaproteobacteria bacterium]MBW2064824.1 hypothetical protein [Deltaproteobacteria bacterium]
MRKGSNNTVNITRKDFPYFRGIWNRVVLALLAASFVPLILIGGVMYFYAMSMLKESVGGNLQREVVHHKETIDGFFEARIRELRLLSSNLSLESFSKAETLEAVFHSLRSEVPCFTDLGVVDEDGRHLAYVGPYDLISRNYKETEWFRSVMEQGEYVSDLFLGFRNEPHLIIAVKTEGDGGAWVLRATVDGEYLDRMVSSIDISGSGEAFLINREGVFQSNPSAGKGLMTRFELGEIEPFEGVKMLESKGEVHAMVWLDKAPWMCVVKIDRATVHNSLQRTRTISIFVFVLGGILIVMTVLLTTNYLVAQLEVKQQSLSALKQRFQSTSHIVTAVELYSGFLREIGDTLANIDVATVWCSEAVKQKDLQEIAHGANQIRSEVARGRKSIEKMADFMRPREPIASETNINELLREVLDAVGSELRFRHIRVQTSFQRDIPTVASDRWKLRLVFLNIILNALYAIDKGGDIRISTKQEKGGVVVNVVDSGPGIPEQEIETIFDPFFTTRTGHIGLGLTTCREIMDQLGGGISARNSPGQGASFTILIPFKMRPPGSHETVPSATASPS